MLCGFRCWLGVRDCVPWHGGPSTHSRQITEASQLELGSTDATARGSLTRTQTTLSPGFCEGGGTGVAGGRVGGTPVNPLYLGYSSRASGKPRLAPGADPTGLPGSCEPASGTSTRGLGVRAGCQAQPQGTRTWGQMAPWALGTP